MNFTFVIDISFLLSNIGIKVGDLSRYFFFLFTNRRNLINLIFNCSPKGIEFLSFFFKLYYNLMLLWAKEVRGNFLTHLLYFLFLLFDHKILRLPYSMGFCRSGVFWRSVKKSFDIHWLCNSIEK